MSEFILIIGNKNYSSWSLRPWLAMKQAKIPFEEKMILLCGDDWKGEIARNSPSRKVPVLHHESRVVWDSLAILEYVAWLFPEAGLWPRDDGARAVARSVSAEMHAGFPALRANMPMNIRKFLPGRGRGRGDGVDDDIERIADIWRDCRDNFGYGGPFLFGAFTNADAMFAPVVTRFVTYGVDLDETCRAYVDAVMALPALEEWCRGAKAEPWIIGEDEVE